VRTFGGATTSIMRNRHKVIFSAAALSFLFLVTAFGVTKTWSSESAKFGENSEINDGFPWRNGDHMYYVSSGLQFAGEGYLVSLSKTKERFSDYPFSERKLDYGYTNSTIAPLIYPRVTLPISIGFAYKFIGIDFIWVPSMLAGLASSLLIYRWASREWGKIAGYFSLISGLGSVLFVKYSTGLFLESFVILILCSLLFTLPLSKTGIIPKYAGTSTGILISILALTRQMPQLPILILVLGAVYASITQRRINNEWSRIALTSLPITWVCYTLASHWAPLKSYGYLDVFSNLLTRYKDGLASIATNFPHDFLQSGLTQSLAVIDLQFLRFSNISDPLVSTAASYVNTDPWLWLAVPLFIFGATTVRNPYLLIGFIAVVISSSMNVIFAQGEYRYWSILLPFAMPICGYGAIQILRKFKVYDFLIELLASEPSNKQNSRAKVQANLVRPTVLPLTLLLFLAITLTATFTRYQFPKGDSPLFSVAAPDYVDVEVGGKSQYLCFPDDGQIFLEVDSKSLIPISGSALAHSFTGRPEFLRFGNLLPQDQLSDMVQNCIERAEE